MIGNIHNTLVSIFCLVNIDIIKEQFIVCCFVIVAIQSVKNNTLNKLYQNKLCL